jgi:hypothetical protein
LAVGWRNRRPRRLFFLADRLFPVFARAFGSSASLSDPVGLPV